ncbi:hypothetical protein PFICI_12656 [Pestalotiopsis fici W106-1]|uniref:Saccharopine dehydrogenase NADP binding domain-containing protein n=1 Tax=Pestalotiopsis fici (strain W106-1 / CGMCC3.15140) TaxID=1229662 RepID=W3WRE6_PESFW|nr:uncharacterized protein PFICI_12656 [Pestalotiopsis fici W106-1]ETS75712.1 hypothetical protein PFICI_12656 [Pestalotiopsis fici W106-1]
MSAKRHGRQYDVVVFGATGYTGLMTAEHIAARFPTDTKWALAGRSAEKLQKVVAECKTINADRIQPEIEICSLNDDDLLALARKTFVLITTVGPYAQYGEHAFKACAEAGTHYIDCTGEAPWTLKMIKKYESKAKETGAIIIPQSGVESAPSDVLAWELCRTIRSQLSAPTADVIVEIHELNSVPSGGTLATLLGLFDSFSIQEFVDSVKPYALSPVPHPRGTPSPSIFSRLTGLYNVPNLGLLSTSITAATNASIVQRTWGLFQLEPSRQKEFYGSNFSYQELMKARNFATGIAMHYGAMVAGALLMFVPPFRTLVRKFVFKPGEGPSREDCANEYIEFRGIANPDLPNSRKQAFVKARYQGSMYYLTATLMAHAAATLLQEDVKLSGGVYTPASLGQGYVDRLDENGFKVESKLLDL